ncbi:hypothetical protein PIB30_061938 [Stylosanthes scabra]|uniref:Transposase n=1 Tax=Stylosanthes scabra TaxID=79078 RepID=A0ABU6VJY8_9FABA|nr:hypothetical protein [Stylosanthes scabra]
MDEIVVPEKEKAKDGRRPRMKRNDILIHHEVKEKTTCSKVIKSVEVGVSLMQMELMSSITLIELVRLIDFKWTMERLQREWNGPGKIEGGEKWIPTSIFYHLRRRRYEIGDALTNHLLLSLFNELSPNKDIQGVSQEGEMYNTKEHITRNSVVSLALGDLSKTNEEEEGSGGGTVVVDSVHMVYLKD